MLRQDQSDNKIFPLYCRCIIDRKKKDYSLKIFLSNTQWDTKNECVIKHPDYKHLNFHLENLKHKIKEEVYNCMVNDLDFSHKMLADIIFGRKSNKDSFYEFALNEIQNNNELSETTKRRYKTQINKIQHFKTNLSWKELTPEFIEKYKGYMKNNLGNCENTYYKSLVIIKTYVNLAVKKGLIKESIFKNIKLKTVQGKREFLNIGELELLEEIYKSNKLHSSQQNVLSYFLFCCYTGLRYFDVSKMRWDNISDDIVNLYMHKTKDLVRIPLINAAKNLLPYEKSDKYVFKVISNQKTNLHLKEICEIAGINKTISFHCSRHTFATIGLTLGIPIEVISKLLGHKDIKQTMVYAKVVDTLKIQEMKRWNNR